MDAITAYDKAKMVSYYLKLMWTIHENIEGMNPEELNLYRIGIQTFLFEAQDAIDEVIDALGMSKEEE